MSLLSTQFTAMPLPDSPVHLCLSLAKGTFTPHDFWLSPHFRFKFFLRSLLMPVKTYRLLKMLTAHPAYYELILNQPRLPCRIQRPYLSTALNNQQRVNAILCHYQTLTTFLSLEAFKKHLGADGLMLSDINGKNDRRFVIQLTSTHRLDKEGECSVMLKSDRGQMLAEITFTLCQQQGKLTMIVGGLQGPNDADAQARVQQATKSLHGLFPKRLVLDALTHFASRLGVQAIYAVSNERHVYQSRRYKNRTKYMHADYNAFWTLAGGVKMASGFYSLPLIPHQKVLDKVASKKRAEYRRRYALLDDIRQQIDRSVCGIV